MKYLKYFMVLSMAMVVSCTSKSTGGPTILTADTEPQIRSILNIPPDAKEVLIVSQSSHWDIDWQSTFDDYYSANVAPIIKNALDMLDAYKGYYYSICEMAFLKRYWDDHPQDHARIIKYLKDGQLRIVGGGLTSPDTNLPAGEALIMDWLYGNAWVEGIAGIKPVTAWQPDSFGHGESLPDILDSLGYKYVGFSRIPGDAGSAQWAGTAPLTPGSFAAQLFSAGSLDFVWQGIGGAQVLAHFLYGGYGYGDSTFYSGALNLTATDNGISNLISHLKPVSPTGYMFVPVGADFMPPDKYLPLQIASWNSTGYPSTGVYVTIATFEDYMKLVSFHSSQLPVYNANLNPYFTGYYASRPRIKKLARQVTYGLEAAQLYSILAGQAGYSYPSAAFDSVWEPFLRSDHHDFIPGTSTDNVYYNEQIPLLLDSLTSTALLEQSATTSVAQSVDTSSVPGIPVIVFNPSGFVRSGIATASVSFSSPGVTAVDMEDPAGSSVPAQIITATTYTDGSYKNAVIAFYAADLPSLGYAAYSAVAKTATAGTGVTVSTDVQGDVVLTNQYETLVLGKDAGYAITSLSDRATGMQLIAGPSDDIVYYEDNGDLWSIGSEPDAAVITGNGIFAQEYALSQTTSSTATVTDNGPLFARVDVQTAGPYGTVSRTYTVYSVLQRIDLSTTIAAPTGTTVAAVFSTTVVDGADRIAIPYGIQQEPFQSQYTPSFWPGVEWADLFNPADSSGMAIFDLGSEMWSFDAQGQILLGLVRNPLFTGGSCLDKGICASDNDTHTLVYAIMPHASGAFFTPEGYAFSSPLTTTVTTNHTGTLPASFSLASTGGNALITAVKLSRDEKGVILRLFRLTQDPGPVSVTYQGSGSAGALITDSYETPIGRPVINGSTIGLTMTGTISTLYIPLQ